MRKSTLLKTYLIISFFAISLTGFGQVKIGTNPTTIESTSNLEVEASTTGRKLKVDKTSGQLTVADGTQGTGKVLTSDAQGGASWQTPGSLQIDQTVFIGRQTGSYVITNFAGVFNVLKDRIPLDDVQVGSLIGYNPVSKQYTIQESGNYRVFTGAKMVGTIAPPVQTFVNLYLFPWHVLNQATNVSSSTGPVLSTFWEGHLNAGEVVDLYVNSVTPSGAQNIIVTNAFLTVVKLAY